jgi:hypothetical protein
VTGRGFPPLDAAIAGQFGFTRSTDYRSADVLVAYRPLGQGYDGWGLIAKIDTAEAYEPVNRLRRLLPVLGGAVLSLGFLALLLGLLASNAIVRRFAQSTRQ